MSDKSGKAIMIILAVLCLVICLVQGAVYYATVTGDGLALAAKTVLNMARAFVMEAELSISELEDWLALQQDARLQWLGWAYMTSLVLAPLCTAAALLLAIRRLMYRTFAAMHNLRKTRVVVFGDTSWARDVVRGAAADHRAIYFPDQPLTDEAELGYTRAGITLVPADTPMLSVFRKYRVNRASYVALMSWQETDNFAAFCQLADYLDKVGCKKPITCFLLYEHYELGALVNRYHETLRVKDKLELVMINPAEQTARDILQERPLYSANIHSDALAGWDPASGAGANPWDVHLVIAGFGAFGRQLALQSMSQGVLHGSARLVMDVFDLNIEQKLGVFLRQFAPGATAALQRGVAVGGVLADAQLTLPLSGCMDGCVVMRFFSADVHSAAFEDLVAGVAADAPITYAAVCFGDVSAEVGGLVTLDRALRRQGDPHVPLMLYLEAEGGLRQVLQTRGANFADVCVVGDAPESVRLDQLKALAEDPYAMQFNHHYNLINENGLRDPSSWSQPQQFDAAKVRESWHKMDLKDQEASRLVSEHQNIKRMLVTYYGWLETDRQQPFAEYLAAHPDGNEELRGRLVQLLAIEDTAAFVAALNADAALRQLGMLEHRRWAQVKYMQGFSYAPLSNKTLLTNKCLITWDELCRSLPDYCRYDMVSLAML